MKNKFIQAIPLFLALAIIAFSYFSLWCTGVGNICYRTLLDQISITVINPFYFFALYVLPLAIILVLISRETFKTWVRFSLWALPLAFLFVATTDVTSTKMGLEPFPFYRDDAARAAAVIYSLASLVVFVYSVTRAHIYTALVAQSSVERASESVRDLRILFTAGIGLAATVVAGYIMFFTPGLGLFIVLVLTGLAAALTTLYALGAGVILALERVSIGVPVGRRLSLALGAATLTVTAVAAVWLYATYFLP